MNQEKLPLPQVATLLPCLRAFSALDGFNRAEATHDDWVAMAETFNSVNALLHLGKKSLGISAEAMKIAFLALKGASLNDGQVELDRSLLRPVSAIVFAYESALKTMARKTIAEAEAFVDRCVATQAAMDTDSWLSSYELPPMLIEPKV